MIDIGTDAWTPMNSGQHLARGCELLAEAGTPGLSHAVAAQLAQRATAHFLAAQALGGLPYRDLGERFEVGGRYGTALEHLIDHAMNDPRSPHR
ncbi:hypothetical protein OIE66_06290 [Nonomuraea sp. NBC_01738]|uniref:hypothetical protein n=1 Tax=Nonomuraea sp. NBC_01738 TaxID=2976003 RepID=UPI002E0E7F5C|nr:hypothetical protein OIE66_06290 [Nonomuraea sp. NBC_01738]